MSDYDTALFAVSFYLLDDDELWEHGVEFISSLDVDVHLLSLTLEDESEDERREHRQGFEEFAEGLRDEGIEVEEDLREDEVGYEEVSSTIADEAEEHEVLIMGHTRVRDPESWTTADDLINTVSVPVVVIPLNAPRFRGI